MTIIRIVNGMWQVAGGHGYIDHELAIADIMRYHDAGFTTIDTVCTKSNNLFEIIGDCGDEYR